MINDKVVYGSIWGFICKSSYKNANIERHHKHGKIVYVSFSQRKKISREEYEQ